EAQHRSHVGMDHTRTLDDAAHRPTSVLDGEALGPGVRRHDGASEVQAAVVPDLNSVEARGDALHRKVGTDDSRGGDDDVMWVDPEFGTRNLRKLDRIFYTLLTRRAI